MINQLQFPGMPDPLPRSIPEDRVWVRDSTEEAESMNSWRRQKYERIGRDIKATAQGRLMVRADGFNVPDIVRSGAIRTQHDTGSSNGMFDPGLREDFESTVLGVERPVYGYIEPPDHEGLYTSVHSPVDQYGDVDFEIDRSLRDRTTVTLDDSLGKRSEDEVQRLGDVAAGYINVEGGAHWKPDVDYLEAQIDVGGELPLSKIQQAHVNVSASPRGRSPRSRNQGDATVALTEGGIPWRERVVQIYEHRQFGHEADLADKYQWDTPNRPDRTFDVGEGDSWSPEQGHKFRPSWMSQ